MPSPFLVSRCSTVTPGSFVASRAANSPVPSGLESSTMTTSAGGTAWRMRPSIASRLSISLKVGRTMSTSDTGAAPPGDGGDEDQPGQAEGRHGDFDTLTRHRGERRGRAERNILHHRSWLEGRQPLDRAAVGCDDRRRADGRNVDDAACCLDRAKARDGELLHALVTVPEIRVVGWRDDQVRSPVDHLSHEVVVDDVEADGEPGPNLSDATVHIDVEHVVAGTDRVVPRDE